MKLLTVDTLQQAKQKISYNFDKKQLTVLSVELDNACGKILAHDIIAQEDIPSFYRSTVDGYAVKSKDTQGASENIPTLLEIVEEVSIGNQSKVEIASGQCAYVPTGGMLPKGADAMVMVEYSEVFDINHVAIYDSIAFGRSVVVPGEDAKQGEIILKKGTILNAPQIGVLAAAGVWIVPVFKPIRLSIISTGDELVPVEKSLQQGQMRDVNTWAIKALAQQAGMEVVMTKMLNDDEALLKETIKNAMEISDLVLTSGGSSQGKKDMTSQILDEVSDGGVITHGLSIKPGKPTIIAFDDRTDTLLVGLPGHPVAALTVFQILIVWLIQEKTGQSEQMPLLAKIQTNVAGAPGKTTCLLLEIIKTENDYIAKPILGKSGLINTMVRAYGYTLIEMNREGLQKGEMVEVYRFGM